MEQLQENIDLFQQPLTGSLTSEDEKLISKVKATYDKKIAVGCTACGYCMPCPSGVNIPNVFRTYNNVAIGGDLERFRSVYNFMLIQREAEASRCTECGECEEVCPQHLPIIRQLKEAHEMLSPK